MTPRPAQLRIYETTEGAQPFSDWIESVADFRANAAVFSRLERLRIGLFGDCKSVGFGVQELRVNVGPGYRIYFGRDGASLVILLVGGTKASQRRDILRAKDYWRDYKRRSDA